MFGKKISHTLKIIAASHMLIFALLGGKKMNKSVVLVIAHEGFQPYEYSEPKKILQKAGFRVITASDQIGMAHAADGTKATVDMTIDQIKPESYAGIFLVGGPGALDHLDKSNVYALMEKAKNLGKAWGAICISPRILARAKLLKNMQITGWDGDNELKNVCSEFGCIRVKEPVIVDGMLVTAEGPQAAEQFGHSIVQLLNSKK